eukprot:SAG22_NODE_2833_length_2169_cov_0.942512_4_plen_97_part_00
MEWSSLVVNGGAVLELDPVHGTLQPFLDDSPWHAGTQVQLDAGGARLAAEVLQEVPEQLLGFMKSKNIKPNPPPPPSATTVVQAYAVEEAGGGGAR